MKIPKSTGKFNYAIHLISDSEYNYYKYHQNIPSDRFEYI